MEEEQNIEQAAQEAEQIERKRQNAAQARARTARLRALGLNARGNPLKDRHKNRNAAKQLKYQANFNARNKAARKRLGLTIREFMQLPRETRQAEYDKLKNGPVDPKERNRAAKREWYRQNKDKVMAARRAKNDSNGPIPAPRRVYQINECPSCGCPIRVLQVALQFEEDRKYGVQ